MRHQSRNITTLIANARDIQQRAIRICRVGDISARIAVLPQDLIIRLQFCERGFVRKIASFPVRNRHAQNFSGRNPIRKRRIVRDRFQVDEFAMELQITIANQRAGQQPRFRQHLKSVANANHQSAIVGELFHRLHHGTESRNRAAAQIIAIAEAARNDHAIRIAQRGFLVPDQARGMTELANRVNGILIAI